MSIRTTAHYTLAITILLALAPFVSADTPALSFSSYGSYSTASSYTKGWEFTTSTLLTVTALGVYDFGGDGLEEAHDVGIWRTSDQQLITSLTVPPGTAGTLIDGFRYSSLPTVVQLPADTYRIGAYYPASGYSDEYVYGASGISMGGIGTYNDPGLSRSNPAGLTYPTDPEAPGGYFGPNFLFGGPSGTWVGTSGDWSDPGNWEGGVIADGADGVASFVRAILSTETVTLDSNRTLGGMVFADSNAPGDAWIVAPAAGEGLTLSTTTGVPEIETITDATVSVGLAGTQGFVKSGGQTLILSGDSSGLTGTISIQSGLLLPVASNALGAGIVEVDGGTLEITTGAVNAGSHLRLGMATEGTVDHNGGTLNVNGTTRIGNTATGMYDLSGTGELTVSAEWLVVGYQASGTVNHTGGSVTLSHASGKIYLGEQASGTGQYDLSIGTVEAENLYVGLNGEGTFNQIGGTSTFTNIYVGRNAGSDGELTVSGATTVLNATTLDVGGNGAGSLLLEVGGRVESNDGVVGGPSGQVTVRDAGTIWNVGVSFYVGTSGPGQLTVSNGGELATGDGNYLGAFDDDSTGTAHVTGAGSLWSAPNLAIGATTASGAGRGELTVTAGGMVRADVGLSIDLDSDHGSFIHLDSGGMLAVGGDAEADIAAFLDLLHGTDAVYYWQGSQWAHITDGVKGVDYTLEYHTTGDLAGLTVLTVTGASIFADGFESGDTSVWSATVS